MFTGWRRPPFSGIWVLRAELRRQWFGRPGSAVMNTVVDTTVMDAPDDLDGVDGGGGRRGRPSGPFDHLQLLEVDLEYPAVVAVLAAFVVAGWRPPTRSGGNAILTQHPDDARSIPL